MEFQGTILTPLGKGDLEFAAETIGCEVRAIKAVSQVEAPHGGFIPDGRPTILFESHVFHTQTDGRYDAVHMGISTPTWVHNYGNYGPPGAHQYDRLHEAILLNRKAALASASWGKYQIMGFNFYDAGYDTIEDFVTDMCHSEAYQCDAFVAYILNNFGIQDALIDKDWITFAELFNGRGQVAKYAADIAAAYESM